MDRLIRLEYSDEIIYTTSEHPFYVQDKWVNAADLIPGDLLHLGERGGAPLSKKTVISGRFTNIEDDLKKYPGTYFTEEQLKQKIIVTKERLKEQSPV